MIHDRRSSRNSDRLHAGHQEVVPGAGTGDKSWKVRRIPLQRALHEELRMRVGRFLPIINPWGFARMVRRYSGVTRFHAHQLGHTFACRWLEQGGSLAALQQVLGHSSIVTTQRYARISDDMVRREGERLEMVVLRIGVRLPEAAPRACELGRVLCRYSLSSSVSCASRSQESGPSRRSIGAGFQPNFLNTRRAPGWFRRGCPE
jgi:hypothetical protein